VRDWFDYYKPTNDTIPKKRIGAALDCFCQNEFEGKGSQSSSQIYEDSN